MRWAAQPGSVLNPLRIDTGLEWGEAQLLWKEKTHGNTKDVVEHGGRPTGVPLG